MATVLTQFPLPGAPLFLPGRALGPRMTVEGRMVIKVTWVNGSESDLDIETLRELDSFLGRHRQDGVEADLKPHDEGLRLVFTSTAATAAA